MTDLARVNHIIDECIRSSHDALVQDWLRKERAGSHVPAVAAMLDQLPVIGEPGPRLKAVQHIQDLELIAEYTLRVTEVMLEQFKAALMGQAPQLPPPSKDTQRRLMTVMQGGKSDDDPS